MYITRIESRAKLHASHLSTVSKVLSAVIYHCVTKEKCFFRDAPNSRGNSKQPFRSIFNFYKRTTSTGNFAVIHQLIIEEEELRP